MGNRCGACRWCAGYTDPSPCVKKRKKVNQWDPACKKGFEPYIDGVTPEYTPEEEAIADEIWDRIYHP